MKIIILAAGAGSRLKDHDLPKTLVTLVDGKSILQHQLDAIQKFTHLENVLIVVGYRKEKIIQQFPDIKTVENLNYAQENTSKSLFKGLSNIDEDVIWINGDVVFHPEVFEKTVLFHDNAVVVNRAEVGVEEVKYRSDSNGNIIEIAKNVTKAEGEAIGINRIQQKDLDIFRKNLEKCQDDDYFEQGIQYCIEEGVSFHSITIPNDQCVEVDFPEDLIRANQLISKYIL